MNFLKGFALLVLMLVVTVLGAIGLGVILTELELVGEGYAFGLSLFAVLVLMLPVACCVQKSIDGDE